MFYGWRVNEHERRLALVVEGILDSYREHGNINHLDGSNLPARSEVSELLDDRTRSADIHLLLSAELLAICTGIPATVVKGPPGAPSSPAGV